MIDNWRKSTFSVDNSSCVETGWAGDTVGYRDTKHPEPTLIFSRGAARDFLAMVRK